VSLGEKESMQLFCVNIVEILNTTRPTSWQWFSNSIMYKVSARPHIFCPLNHVLLMLKRFRVIVQLL